MSNQLSSDDRALIIEALKDHCAHLEAAARVARLKSFGLHVEQPFRQSAKRCRALLQRLQQEEQELSAQDVRAVEEAAKHGYELKRNFVANPGFYFVEQGDRDDAPRTFANARAAWEYVKRRDGIEGEE